MDVREEAALILAVCASTRQWGISIESAALGVDAEVQNLALAAWRHVEPHYDLQSFGSLKVGWDENWAVYFDICAEAEALLRCGWSP